MTDETVPTSDSPTPAAEAGSGLARLRAMTRGADTSTAAPEAPVAVPSSGSGEVVDDLGTPVVPGGPTSAGESDGEGPASPTVEPDDDVDNPHSSLEAVDETAFSEPDAVLTPHDVTPAGDHSTPSAGAAGPGDAGPAVDPSSREQTGLGEPAGDPATAEPAASSSGAATADAATSDVTPSLVSPSGTDVAAPIDLDDAVVPAPVAPHEAPVATYEALIASHEAGVASHEAPVATHETQPAAEPVVSGWASPEEPEATTSLRKTPGVPTEEPENDDHSAAYAAPYETEPYDSVPAQRRGFGVAAILVTAVLTIGLIAMSYLYVNQTSRHNALASDNRLRASATAAARSYAISFTQFDYQNFDAELAQLEKISTPNFQTKLDGLKDALGTALQSAMGKSTSTIDDVAVETLSDKAANVLVFVDQANTNSQVTTPRVDQFRLIVKLQRNGDGWLVDDIEVV